MPRARSEVELFATPGRLRTPQKEPNALKRVFRLFFLFLFIFVAVLESWQSAGRRGPR